MRLVRLRVTEPQRGAASVLEPGGSPAVGSGSLSDLAISCIHRCTV